MPIKEKRVGTEVGKKSQSAYEKDRVGTERREEAKSAYQRKKGRHGERKEE